MEISTSQTNNVQPETLADALWLGDDEHELVCFLKRLYEQIEHIGSSHANSKNQAIKFEANCISIVNVDHPDRAIKFLNNFTARVNELNAMKKDGLDYNKRIIELIK